MANKDPLRVHKSLLSQLEGISNTWCNPVLCIYTPMALSNHSQLLTSPPGTVTDGHTHDSCPFPTMTQGSRRCLQTKVLKAKDHVLYICPDPLVFACTILLHFIQTGSASLNISYLFQFSCELSRTGAPGYPLPGTILQQVAQEILNE